jgi:hypothetical protein
MFMFLKQPLRLKSINDYSRKYIHITSYVTSASSCEHFSSYVTTHPIIDGTSKLYTK